MELIGHRGCGAIWPENTVRAVRRTARVLPAVEIDVRRCGSGELVCLHDETVDRTTDGTGPVGEFGLERLQQLRVANSDAVIPTLEMVLDVVPEETTVQIELKEEGIGADVLDLVTNRETVRLSSFSMAALEEVADGLVPFGYLFRDESGAVEAAAALGCATVHPHWRRCVETDIVDRAHDRGFDVIAWGAKTDPDAVRAAAAAGVDGITVDRPDLATNDH